MYYRDLETNPKAKAEHNRRQRVAAADRLKANKAKRKASKKEA